MNGLESHPGEGNQQEVVKEPGSGNAEAHSIRIECQPRVYQKDQVQHQQSQAQLDQDFGWNVLTQLPVVFTCLDISADFYYKKYYENISVHSLFLGFSYYSITSPLVNFK